MATSILDPHDQHIRENTARFRLLPQLRSAVASLATIRDKAMAITDDEPLRGRAAIVCGAGAALDRNVALLADAAADAVIFCTNTSAAIVPGAHYIVTTEGIDVSRQIPDEHCGEIVAGLGASPGSWSRAGMWFCDPTPWWSVLARDLGAEPVHTGGAAVNAAAAIALRWGCSSLILVGVDLGYEIGTGRTYATGTQWQDLSVNMDEDGNLVVGGDAVERRHRLHMDSGVPGTPLSSASRRIAGWGGGCDVFSPPEFTCQVDWFAAIARREAGRTRMINATEGGAHIDGYDDVRLEDVLRDIRSAGKSSSMLYESRQSRRHVTEDNLVRAVKRLREHARRGREMTRAYFEATDSDAVMECARGLQYVEAFSMPDIVALKQSGSGLDLRARLEIVYTVWDAAAHEIDRLLDEAGL